MRVLFILFAKREHHALKKRAQLQKIHPRYERTIIGLFSGPYFDVSNTDQCAVPLELRACSLTYKIGLLDINRRF